MPSQIQPHPCPNDWIALEEQPTGVNWFDGKPIFRKLVYFGFPPSNNIKDVPHKIPNVENFVLIRGIIRSERKDTWFNADGILLLWANQSRVFAESSDTKWVQWKLYVVLEYTKQ